MWSISMELGYGAELGEGEEHLRLLLHHPLGTVKSRARLAHARLRAAMTGRR
jgi:hypothetical protein